MIKTIKNLQFTILPYLMITLAISIRHYSITCSVYYQSRSVILCSSLVNRQRESTTDIVSSQLLSTKHINSFWRIKWIKRLSENTTSDCIFTQHSCWSHQDYCLKLVASQCSCKHTCYYSTLRMSGNSNTVHIR